MDEVRFADGGRELQMRKRARSSSDSVESACGLDVLTRFHA